MNFGWCHPIAWCPFIFTARWNISTSGEIWFSALSAPTSQYRDHVHYFLFICAFFVSLVKWIFAATNVRRNCFILRRSHPERSLSRTEGGAVETSDPAEADNRLRNRLGKIKHQDSTSIFNWIISRLTKLLPSNICFLLCDSSRMKPNRPQNACKVLCKFRWL